MKFLQMERKLWLSIFSGIFFLTVVELGSTSTVHVRLVDNSVPNAGRVELGYKGVWKSVCDSGWNINQANVVCRMLGYSQAAIQAIKGMTSNDDAWLSTISCRGHETTIEQCAIMNTYPTRCARDKRAGVVCSAEQDPNVAVRLVDRNLLNQSRVEVRYYGVWGTVCDNLWDLEDAHVVCRMSNYGKASWAGTAKVKGSGPIILDEVNCRGSEKSLDHCQHKGWGKHDCYHSQDAGVKCDRQTQEESSVTVRLLGTDHNNFSFVEVNYNGTWRPVCDDTWDISDAHVVCRMLGYKAALAAIKRFSEGKAGLWMSGVECSGDEVSISECYHRGWSNEQCYGLQYAGIRCKNKEDQLPNLAVRLMNGSSPNQGRVEVRYHGVWGTVCNYNWDLADAHVVCRMLNYSKASWAGNAKVEGSGYILLDGVSCRGNEKSLEQCKLQGEGQHICQHNEDAGVTCAMFTREESSVAVRLAGFDHNNISFVEVHYNGTWRPVCDDTWDMLDAHVVCRMLGYKAALAAIKRFSKGKVGLWMSGVECSGDEVAISECYHRGWSENVCHGNYLAGILCQPVEDPTVQIRLEDGSSPNSGRVAVRYGNVWGTICNRGLDINDTKVICYMLGYPGASKVYSLQTLMLEVRPIWLSNLECNGTEKSIVDCRHSGWMNITTCSHDNDGAITCNKTDSPQFQINGANDISESTVLVSFFDSKTVDGQLKRIYQVAVEKRHDHQHFKSYEQPPPFVYNEVNVTMAIQMGSHSYITAEILGPLSNLTIGDGQYYHGYYNAPLEPRSMYRVHVRIVTMAIDGKRVYGLSAFVEFTTKSLATEQGKSANTNGEIKQNALIALAVVVLLLLCVFIGLYLWYVFKNKKTMKNDNAKPKVSGGV